MKLLELREKINRGILLGGEVVYIKSDNILYGIKSILNNKQDNKAILIKCSEETMKSSDLIKIIDKIIETDQDIEICIGELNKDNNLRSSKHDIVNIEFAQYDLMKIIFINI